MAQSTPVKLHWSRKLQFHVSQAKHCSDTGNFTYFDVHRAQYLAEGIDHVATLKAQNVADTDMDELRNINVATTESSETATTELEGDIKAIKVNDKLPEQEQQAEWVLKLEEKNTIAKNKVNNAMDASLNAAINLISAMPESSQDAAANFFMAGVDIAMEAFDYMVQKISQLYQAAVDLIKKIWTALTNVVNLIGDKVVGCVKKLFGLNSAAPTQVSNAAPTQVSKDGTINIPAVNHRVVITYKSDLSYAQMITYTQSVWDRYVGAGGTFQAPYVIGPPTYTGMGNFETSITWNTTGNDALQLGLMTTSCNEVVVAVSHAWPDVKNPMTYTIQ